MTPRDRLAEIYALAGARDWDAVAQQCHPDFTVHEAECLPFGGRWSGRDALRHVAEAMYATWAEASVDIHEITGGEAWAVVVLTLTMHPKDGSAPFAQTVNEAGRFEDGLLRELRIHYLDAAEVAARACGDGSGCAAEPERR